MGHAVKILEVEGGSGNLLGISKISTTRAREGLREIRRVEVVHGGGKGKAACNESTYLRVVGFRESMHDYDDDDDYLEPRTLSNDLLFSFRDPRLFSSFLSSILTNVGKIVESPNSSLLNKLFTIYWIF